MHRKQLTVFFILLAVYALCAFLSYTFFIDQLTAFAGTPIPDMGVPPVVFGLANAGIVLVVYGLLGMAGYWMARKLGLPGIFREDGNWNHWLFIPMGIGIVCGAILVVGDNLFALINGFGRFPQLVFPSSFLASLSAGIGEEIAFRGFVFGIWAIILNWLFRPFNGHTAALWIANGIAALAFAVGHLGFILLMIGASSISQVNPILLAEVFLLNGLIGLLAGERFMKDGLVAAAGVHFWTDVVFHVVWGLFISQQNKSYLKVPIMLRKLLISCGFAAPVLYVLTVIVGAAMRPDYSHIVNAVSELLSNGAPNKAVFDIVFNVYGALLLAFAIGGYYILRNGPRLCRIAFVIFIGIQIISFSWGFFPMDPLGSEATFSGTVHNALGAVVALATIVMPLFMGLGLKQVSHFHGYSVYSIITSALIFVSGLTGVILAGQGVRLFGLFERITIGSYEVWIFVTALRLLKTDVFEQLKVSK